MSYYMKSTPVPVAESKSNECEGLKWDPSESGNGVFVEVKLIPESESAPEQKQRQKPRSKSNPKSRGWRRFAGVFLTLLSCVTLSLMALVTKVLKEYHPFTLSFWRYFGSGVPSFFIVLWYIYWKKEQILAPLWPEATPASSSYSVQKSADRDRDQDWRANLSGILSRGLVGVLVTILRFSALKYLTLADVSVITQSYSTVVFVFAFLFLHEKISLVAIISALLAICGVAVLSRPPLITGESTFNEDTLVGIGFASGAMFASAISIVLTRKLRRINFALLTCGIGLIGMVISGGLAAGFGVFKLPRSANDWLLNLSVSGLAFVSQIMSVLAIKYEEAGVISIVKISYVLFAIVWQILLLRVYPDMISMLGAAIVLSALVLTGVRKWVNTLPESNRIKEELRCFLL